MNVAVRDLEIFLKSNAKNEQDLVLDICNFELGTILSDTLKKLNQTEYLKSNVKTVIQKIRNTVFEEEIFKIADAAVKAGIKLVFLKGLFLGRALYDKVEIRQSVDIDFLIDEKDLVPALEIIRTLNYYPYVKFQGPRPWSYAQEKFNTYKSRKHVEFYRQVDLDGKKFGILLELHLRILQPNLIKTDTSALIERSIARDEKGHTIRLLEAHDNLLLLFMHFYEHFIVAFNFYCCGKLGDRQNLQNLHDIALLLDKYAGSISWDIMLERAEAIQACINLALPVHLFNCIYPGRIPEEFLKALILKDADTANSTKRLCYKLIHQLSATDVFCGDFEKMLKKMSPLNNNLRQSLSCPTQATAETDKTAGKFVIDELAENIENLYGTYISSGTRPNSSAEGSALGRIYWDPEYLYFNITVKKVNPVFKGQVSSFHEQDGVELLLNNGQNLFYNQIVFAPIVNNGQPEVVYIDGKSVSLIDKDKLYSNVIIHDEGYELSSKIPWSFVDITPHKGQKLRFNIAINLCNEITGGRKTRLVWAGTGDWWWDVDWYGELVLKD